MNSELITGIETMQKNRRAQTDSFEIIVSIIYMKKTPGCFYSSVLTMCLYMAFLLWFHKPVLHFVATSHMQLKHDITFCSV